MRFDEKKDAIKHLKSLLGDRCTIDDNGQEVLVYGEDMRSFYEAYNGVGSGVKMKLIYKIALDENGRYWNTYLNRNGIFIKMAG
ncbi:MAG: hypothetical protein WC998_09020 [Candidatus Paceibacterota bacterium]|jgi:hypothetical protein